MYKGVKNVLIFIIPKYLLFSLEPLLRRLYSVFFIGEKYQCTICEGRWRKWIEAPPQKICPKCGSIARTRRLYSVLKKEYLQTNFHILDFSPSRALYRKLKKQSNIKYFSTDFSNEFLADFRYDICKLDSADAIFDLIVCFHVLEHIENDRLAMEELYRVLKHQGRLLVQTPFKEGDVLEDANVKTPEDRLKKFGQSDHVRIYSVKELQKRLQLVGFDVEVKQFSDVKNNTYGFNENETLMICTKK